MDTHLHSQFFAKARGQAEAEAVQSQPQDTYVLKVTDVEHITHALVALDRQWRVIYISQQAAQLLQKTREELVGKQFWETYPAFVESTFYQHCQRAANSGAPAQFVVESPQQRKWLLLHVYPSSDEIAIFLTDITDQKQNDAQLRFQSTILRHISDCVIVTDLQGNIMYWNEGAGVVFGYTAQEVLGKTPDLLYPEWERRQASRDYEQLLAGIGYDGEWQGRRKDGTVVWVEARTMILRDTEGEAIGLIGIAKDITERKQLIEETIKAKEQLAVILKNVDDGILVQDATGRIIYANDAVAHMAGYASADDLLDAPLLAYLERFDLVDEQGQPFPVSRLPGRRAIQGEATLQVTVCFINKQTQEARWVLIKSTRVPDHGQVSAFVMSMLQDITQFKELEQRKNHFISIASHELRTPVTAISGFAEILQMLVARGQSLESPQSERAINTIVEQSQRLTRLIEEMLDLSRIGQVQLFLNSAPIDLLALLTHVIESQEITTTRHNIRLTLDGLNTTDTLIGSYDADRIEQVFHNLISNAIKYSPNGGEIEVGLCASATPEVSHEALIWVKDQGIGIPPGELPYIFERFHRASNLDHAISGMGIGLYLVKELVMRQGGRVWVESTVGVGSTFFVALPLV